MNQAFADPSRLDPEHGGAEPVADAGNDSQKAFEFVQSLAAELSRGKVELPSYPDVAIRVRQVLADPDVTNERVARVIASDAGLAVRMLALANSAALSRGGRSLTDLKMAVTRIGHQNVRSAALAYALTQIRDSASRESIRVELAKLWETSTMVAALARVIAVKTRAANPDEAQLTGLLHNVGCVYVLARADKYPSLFATVESRDSLMRDWHAHIGKAIAQNWGLPEHVYEAIGDQDTYQPEACKTNLADVLCVAIRAAGFRGPVEELETALADHPAFERLRIHGEVLRTVLTESAEEIEGLRAALGG